MLDLAADGDALETTDAFSQCLSSCLSLARNAARSARVAMLRMPQEHWGER